MFVVFCVELIYDPEPDAVVFVVVETVVVFVGFEFVFVVELLLVLFVVGEPVVVGFDVDPVEFVTVEVEFV